MTNEAIATVADGLAIGLGTLVIHHLKDTSIEPDRLRAILAAEGDDASIVPDIVAAQAVKDAAAKWRKGRGNQSRFKTEIAVDNDEKIVVGILARSVDSTDESVAWEQVDSMEWNKVTDAWSEAPGSVEAQEYYALAERMRTHLDDRFVRSTLIHARMKAWGVFSLRQNGGVYYVPVQHDDDVERLARVVGKIGDCRLDLFTVSDDAKTRASTGRRANEVLGENLGDIRTKLEAWTKRARNVKTDAVSAALDELEVMRGHAQLYSTALSFGIDDLDESIDEAVQMAKDLISGASATKGKRKASPKLQALVEATRKAHGDTVTVEQLKVLGWPTSAYKHASYWGSNAKPTLRAMGLKARLRLAADGTGAVQFSALPGGPVVEPEPTPEPTTPEPTEPAADDVHPDPRAHGLKEVYEPTDEEIAAKYAAIDEAVIVLSKDKSVTVQDLYDRFEAAAHEKSPRLRRGFKKIDLIRDVLVAEAAA